MPDSTPQPILDSELALKNSSNTYPKDRFILLRLVCIILSMFALGVLNVYIRPHAKIDGVHIEAVTSLIVLIVVSIMLCRYYIRNKFKFRYLFMLLNIMVLWAAFVIGYCWASDTDNTLVLNTCATILCLILITCSVYFFINIPDKS